MFQQLCGIVLQPELETCVFEWIFSTFNRIRIYGYITCYICIIIKRMTGWEDGWWIHACKELENSCYMRLRQECDRAKLFLCHLRPQPMKSSLTDHVTDWDGDASENFRFNKDVFLIAADTHSSIVFDSLWFTFLYFSQFISSSHSLILYIFGDSSIWFISQGKLHFLSGM